MKNGQPALLGAFAFGQPWNFIGRAGEPVRTDQLMLFDIIGVSIEAGSISFDRAAGEAHCCPKFHVIQTFRWQNGQFVLAGEEKRPLGIPLRH